MGRLALLTTRETEVLYLLAMGCANREIAARLGIAAPTVKHHLTSIYAALGVDGRIGAVVAWHRYQRDMAALPLAR